VVLPHVTPFLTVLAGVSFVVFISHNFTGAKKVLFISAAFAIASAVSVSAILSNADQLSNIWQQYLLLSKDLKMALAVVVVAATYFGGALYAAGGNPETDTSALLATPASCDNTTDFDVPAIAENEKDDKVFFEGMLKKLCNEIISDLPTLYEMPKEATDYLTLMLEYNVAGGKMNRGLATLDVCKTLAGRSLTARERCKAAALGWCVEFLQAFFLVADDVMDDSVTRRGQPCWFRRPDVKLVAINDSFILESSVYKILKRYFGSEKYYPQLVDLFIEVTRQTELGQLLDLTSQPQDGKVDLKRFTLQRHGLIVKYKTAFYSFYLPVALGMIVAGVERKELFDKAREILCIMGEYFQVQDDYLDCYGAPEVIGKIGTDIQDNKCSWLVVQALAKATPAQRKVLEDNYGKKGDANVKAVKKLYVDMGIEAVYLKYEEESYQRIKKLMDETRDLPTEVFDFLLKKIYKRSK